MFINLEKLNGSNIHAIDDEVGQVADIYFDDRYWTIRFLVVDIHPWLPLSKKTLISPISLISYNVEDHKINISISKDVVKNSPHIDEHETVSREFEKHYFDYYAYGYYWEGMGTWGDYSYPMALANRNILQQDNVQEKPTETINHLRSTNEITHYGIDSLNGKKGYIKDFICDTNDWSLCYLVVDIRNWLPSKKVLISIEQLKTINLEEKTVTCDLDLEDIKSCPEYHPEKLNDPEYLEQVRKTIQANDLALYGNAQS